MRKGLLVVIGFALFAAVNLIPVSLDFFSLLAMAVLVHDLGHLSAMKRFGRKDPEVFILRFFTKWVAKLPEVRDPGVRAVMALSGPLAGLMVVYTALLLSNWVAYGTLLAFAWASCLLNVYDLLPVRPLDGGRLLHCTLLGRHPKLDLYGKYLVVAGLIYASMIGGYWFVALVGVFIFLSTLFSHGTAKIAYGLRQDPSFADRELTEAKVARIRQELIALNAAYDTDRMQKDLPAAMARIWESANRRYAPPRMSAGVLAAYVVLIGLYVFTYYAVILGA
ncbi:MAG: hypothetical protein Q7Q73_17325 [Verrucomicrobiota bacterium JB024]|nr:hypothetical protein [Verrucomicrobiota bacterium JB024]